MTRPDPRLSRISRRALIGSGAAASVLAAAGIGAADAPRPGGTLRIAAPGPEVFGRLIAPGAAFDCLTEVDADGGLRGELAQSWEAQGGGASWTVALRPDARFHDGRPVEVEDVLSSMRAHRAQGAPALADVQRVWAFAGGRQIGFRLAAPDPQFPMRLADPDLVVRPAGDSGTTVGSGLYRIVENDPDRRVKLGRVGDHPRSARGGWFDRVEILRIDDAAQRLAVLLSGRVDLSFALERAAWSALARHRRLEAVKLDVAGRDGGTALAGKVVRLRGLEGRDPLRIAERGFFV